MLITDIHSEEELLREIEQDDNWLENLDQVALEGVADLIGMDEDEELLELDDEESYLL